MNLFIEKSTLKGYIKAPPSKSMAHRLLIAAAISDGTSEIQNIALSEDITATVSSLSALGAEITVDYEDSSRQRYSVPRRCLRALCGCDISERRSDYERRSFRC